MDPLLHRWEALCLPMPEHVRLIIGRASYAFDDASTVTLLDRTAAVVERDQNLREILAAQIRRVRTIAGDALLVPGEPLGPRLRDLTKTFNSKSSTRATILAAVAELERLAEALKTIHAELGTR